MKLPEGYEPARHTAHGVEAFAHTAACTWLESVLENGTRLHDWGARHAISGRTGRGPVHVILAPAPGPDRRERWAFRHCRRGGGAARLLRDRHVALGAARPLRELRVSVEARLRGVRTPAVVAGAAYRTGAVYRADLVTELVPQTLALRDAVFGERATTDASTQLWSSGRLVRMLEEARVLHADLNAGNVLVGSGDDPAWVVDLDRCRTLSSSSPHPKNAMRRRLERSLRKLAATYDRPLSAHEWEALRSGFESAP